MDYGELGFSFELVRGWQGLLAGRVFVTTGDLISELFVSATTIAGETAGIGGTLRLRAGDDVTIVIRIRDPDGENAHGDSPTVGRVGLIKGHPHMAQSEVDRNRNPSAGIVRRFSADDWSREGEFVTMTMQLEERSIVISTFAFGERTRTNWSPDRKSVV